MKCPVVLREAFGDSPSRAFLARIQILCYIVIGVCSLIALTLMLQ